ncbi:hypothetical protein [Streptomyces sp. NRRL S-31]|uniref:hypothetical protein n=1 Tax=Streptomyces sp. NRRL S-31 TaxID=1463898 RepID=UPI0004C8C141|nr:hypothetical protein [Streptomyces sp. NRRL S-31]
MAEAAGRRAVPENVSDPVPAAAGDPATTRLTMAHVLPLILFPAIGTVLFAVGMPVSGIPLFLCYCGGIGAAVTIVVTGGRRALLALAHGVIAASGDK